MKCYDVRRKLSALLDSAVEGDLRDAVARHLDGCAACRAELEALASVDHMVVRTLTAADDAPAGYFDGLWDRLEPKLGPDPELDEIKKLAAEVVHTSGARAQVSLPAAATSLGQVVVPVARPARRTSRWYAAGGAVAAAGALVLAWVWLVRGPRGERVQAPPTTGPEPPPVVSVAPPEQPATPAPPPAPPRPTGELVANAPGTRPAKTEHRAGVPRREAEAKEGGAPAAEPAPAPAEPAAKAEDVLVPPPPAAASPVLPEKLEHEDIERGMTKIGARVQACFDLHSIQGKVMVKVKILPDGGVGSADVEGAPAGTEGGACVAKAVTEARFPPFRGPPMTIRYPFQAE
jgi:outer membrane biosynthesis protein TonB